MYTLQPIREMMIRYTDALSKINVKTDEEFHAAHKTAKEDFESELFQFRDAHPEWWLTSYAKNLSRIKTGAVVDQIAENARGRFALDVVPNYSSYLLDSVQRDKICTPSYTPGDTVEVNVSTTDKETLTDIYLSVLLSLPIKKLHFTIVDLQNTYVLDYFYGQIPPSLYGEQPITQEFELSKFIEKMNTRVLSCVQKYGDLEAYNKKNQTIVMPYEVVVIIGEVDRTNSAKLRGLCSSGRKGGVYVHFVNIQNNQDKVNTYSNHHIQDIPNLESALLSYIKAEADAKEEKKTLTLDIDKEGASPYTPLNEAILVPVGEVDSKEKLFTLDLSSHPHAFVLGQSGSGKSVFLHNVISGAMLKYTPEELEVYLMDFKLGGVEFNRYRGEKHVHAMLVDNSDQQITLEILRELRERMAERGKQLRDSEVCDIKEYNAKHPDQKMPQILFVADECHELFRVGSDIPRAISTEISEIITKIAKEGRSQGVHLLLATQTLSGTEISNEILNNISDHYLLKCSVGDSERMVMNSSEKTANLVTGQIYHHHVSQEETFQAFFTDKKASEKLVKTINEKATDHCDNNVFYFSGASLFRLDETVIKANTKKCRRNAVSILGKSINLKQDDVCLMLKEDFSENVLMVGLNDQEQVTRVMMSALLSSMMANTVRGNDVEFTVIDCLANVDSIYSEMLDTLAEQGKINLIMPRKRGEYLKTLAEEVQSGKTKETMLFIFGQDKFRELKLDMEFENQATTSNGMPGIFMGGGSTTTTSVTSFRSALNIILEKGPELGVHTILQVEKPSNILFMDYISPKALYQKFKHLILLKSEERASSQLGLRDDIRLENLSREAERMRAYYYSEESDEYALFTPFMAVENVESLIKYM